MNMIYRCSQILLDGVCEEEEEKKRECFPANITDHFLYPPERHPQMRTLVRFYKYIDLLDVVVLWALRKRFYSFLKLSVFGWQNFKFKTLDFWFQKKLCSRFKSQHFQLAIDNKKVLICGLSWIILNNFLLNWHKTKDSINM